MENVHKYKDSSQQTENQFRKLKPIVGLKCEICNKPLRNEKTLEKHKSEVHSSKKTVFKCNICDKVFDYKRTLWSHELVHSGTKENQCEICGSSFSTRSFMRDHIKRVHGK